MALLRVRNHKMIIYNKVLDNTGAVEDMIRLAQWKSKIGVMSCELRLQILEL